MSLSGIITSWADCYKTPNIELQTSNFEKIHFTQLLIAAKNQVLIENFTQRVFLEKLIIISKN